MPLTRAQKILAWGSAGLVATASALGVMFYSPTVLNHSSNEFQTVQASSVSKSENRKAKHIIRQFQNKYGYIPKHANYSHYVSEVLHDGHNTHESYDQFIQGVVTTSGQDWENAYGKRNSDSSAWSDNAIKKDISYVESHYGYTPEAATTSKSQFKKMATKNGWIEPYQKWQYDSLYDGVQEHIKEVQANNRIRHTFNKVIGAGFSKLQYNDLTPIFGSAIGSAPQLPSSYFSNGKLINDLSIDTKHTIKGKDIPGSVSFFESPTGHMTADYPGATLGNKDEGAPAHWHLKHQLGQYYDEYDGKYHSYLEYTNLIKGVGNGRSALKIVNPKGKINAVYPNSATVYDSKQDKTIPLDVVVTINGIHYYKPWDTYMHYDHYPNDDTKDRKPSLVFSRNLYHGFMYNGLTDMHVKYTFINSHTKQPLNFNNGGHYWMRFRDINGLSPYKDNVTGSARTDASFNNEIFVKNLWKDGTPSLGENALWYTNKGMKDPTSETIENGNDDNWADATSNEYVYDKNSKIRGYRSKLFTDRFTTGGMFNSSYTSKDDHDVFFDLSKGGAYFHVGSAVGYGNVQPTTDLNVKKHKKPQPHSDNWTPPKPTNTTPVKYITGKNIYHDPKDIDGYSDGAILKKPNQKYEYHIVGYIPWRTVNNTEETYTAYNKDSKGNDIPGTGHQVGDGHYYDGHTGDHFNVNDKIPSDLSVDGTPHMDINGQSVAFGPANSNSQTFNLSRDQWDSYRGQEYNITIPVKANHLPKPTKDGWLVTLNGGRSRIKNTDNTQSTTDNTDTYTWGQEYGSQLKHSDSNVIPTEIKKIKATIWHYDYNHDHQLTNNFFPDNEQPMGITNGVNNPSDADFKNYRFHDHFDPNNEKGKLADPVTKYWYVNTYHNVNTINATRNNNQNQAQRYRFVYPSFKDAVSDISDQEPYTEFFPKPETKFDDLENTLMGSSSKYKNDVAKSDSLAYGNDHVVLNANPDGSDSNNGEYNYRTSDGFTQNNYLPYLVPRISLNQHIKPNGSPSDDPGDFRMVIDTDQAQHGLPFRLDMRTQNLLYGRHYLDDFKGDQIGIKITTNHGKDTLYSNSRPLVGSDNDSSALIHQGGYHLHHDELNETPSGNTNYHGYIEKKALDDATGVVSDTDPYRLNTNNKGYYDGEELPIHVQFTLKDSDNSQDEVDMQDINTHAYIAKRPTLDSNSFGHKVTEGNNNSSDDAPSKVSSTSINPNRATIINPERTIEYGDDPKGSNIRELKEQLSVTQPRHAIGKTGYGISANDFGLNYRGHLEANNYVHHGTSMMFGFPESFNTKDSNISYSHDTRHKHLLGDNLLHVDPSIINDDPYNNLSDYDESPNELDTHHDTADDSGSDYSTESENQVDSDFEDAFPEHLHSGDFSTTYGFYPRKAVNNSGNNHDNGNAMLDGTNDTGSYKPHTKYDDPEPSNSGLTNVSAFGLTTNNNVDTNSGTTSISRDGQNERMFTPLFMPSGSYPDIFHRAFGNTNNIIDRNHRLGGNFFDIDENRPINMISHQYLTKDSNTQKYDELSLQPILTNPSDGLMQTPISNPSFPTRSSSLKDGWLTNSLWAGMYGSHTATSLLK